MSSSNISFLSRIIGVFTLFQLFLTSCLSLMPSANKSPKTHYESYFLENGVEQIFIKPILFKSESGKILIDFTVRTNKDSCIVNFSVLSSQKINNPDSIFIRNNGYLVPLSALNKLYSDQVKSTYKLRFTSKLAVSDLMRLMQNEAWSLMYVVGKNNELFSSQSKSKKVILSTYTALKELISLK